jgi:hypothetical protein
MDDYCKQSGIFFDDNDRIKQQIKASESMYKEYKHTMKGAFREQILKPDYHDKNLRKLLSGEKFDKKESDSMVDDSDDYAMQM